MDFSVYFRTYCSASVGKGPLCAVPDFLLGEDSDFGPAIADLSVHFFLAHSGPPMKGMEERFASFHANRSPLRKVQFRRSRKKVEIHFTSKLMDAKDWEKRRWEPTIADFQTGVRECLAALEALRKKIQPKDQFDLEGFLGHCGKALARMPSTDEELLAMYHEIQIRGARRWAEKSPWDVLGIDFRDFHPKAWKILDDPWFWSDADDFAPHGNDCGADLLKSYRQWLRRNPKGEPIQFYQAESQRWLKPDGTIHAIMRDLPDQAAVALAFAELKLRAHCRPEVAALARGAIQRQRAQAEADLAWKHREGRLASLQKLEAKLPPEERGN